MYLSTDASDGRSVIRNLRPLYSISDGSGLRGVTAAGIFLLQSIRMGEKKLLSQPITVITIQSKMVQSLAKI